MATRYQLGDVLLPEAESFATALPKIIADAKANQLEERRLNQENRRIDFDEKRVEEDRAFKRQQARISQQNFIQQQQFEQSQAYTREMNSLLNSVTEPYQKQAIYNKYGMFDMAAQMEVQGAKEADQKTSLKSFYAVSSAKDIVEEGSRALEGLDPTSAAYGQVVARRDSAFNEVQNSYQDMLKDPRYKFQYDILLASAKMPNADIKGIFEQMDVMADRYEKEKFGGDDDGGGGDDGKALSIDEQADQLVSSILEGDAFKPEDALDLGPQTESDVKKMATQVESSSEVNIGKLQSSLPKLENRKNILDRTSKLRSLTDVQAKELEQINAAIQATKAEIKRQRGSLKQARKEIKPFYTSPTATKLSAL